MTEFEETNDLWENVLRSLGDAYAYASNIPGAAGEAMAGLLSSSAAAADVLCRADLDDLLADADTKPTAVSPALKAFREGSGR